MAGVVDAHRDGKRFNVRVDEKLTGRLGIASRVLLIAKKRIHGTKPRLFQAGTRKLFGISPRFYTDGVDRPLRRTTQSAFGHFLRSVQRLANA